MKKIGTTLRERVGDYIRTYQVVGYNRQNTHEVYELVREVYSPISIDYISMVPQMFDYS